MSFDTMVSVGESKRTTIDGTWNATLCCSSRPKSAYGTTDEAFVYLARLLVPTRPQLKRLHTGGGASTPRFETQPSWHQMRTKDQAQAQPISVAIQKGASGCLGGLGACSSPCNLSARLGMWKVGCPSRCMTLWSVTKVS